MASEITEDEEKDSLKYDGEEQGECADYICAKEEEEVCETESITCSEAKTTSGNILHRMIKDPTGSRPPCLGKWPTFGLKSETNFEENFHQFRAAQQPTFLKQMCSLRVTSEPNLFRLPAIIGTIGPSSFDTTNLLDLIKAGMNIARISMAHVDPCNNRDPIRNIVEASNQFSTLKDFNIPITLMMDLKGPEIRTGKIDTRRFKKEDKNNKEIFLKHGSFVRLTSNKLFEKRCTDKIIFVNYIGLFTQVNDGDTIYLCDGQIKLVVDSIEKEYVVCFVEKAGYLKDYQKVHIPMMPAVLSALTSYDKECLKLAVEMEVDVVVVPMTRNSKIIKDVKKILENEEDEPRIFVFAKISGYEGLENIDEILRVSDGIIMQKNDLSLDISAEKIFVAQKEIIGKCNRVGKPVFCTAEMSSWFSTNTTLRRAEINDISNSIIDGADGVILINETATGNEGVRIVSELSRVMSEAEAVTMQSTFFCDLTKELIPSIEPNNAIALAAVQVANKIQAAAILAVTTSGRTAQLLSWFRPRRPVIAITRVGRVARQMNLFRAVLPLHFTGPLQDDWFHDVKARFEYGISYGKIHGIIESGDLLVLVSGYRKNAGFTNCMRIVFASTEPASFVENVSSYYEDISKDTLPS